MFLFSLNLSLSSCVKTTLSRLSVSLLSNGAGASLLNPETLLASSAEAKEFYSLPVRVDTKDARCMVWARVQGTWWPARRMQPTGEAFVRALESRSEMLVVFIGENVREGYASASTIWPNP